MVGKDNVMMDLKYPSGGGRLDVPGALAGYSVMVSTR
jgi:hypothetical protein